MYYSVDAKTATIIQCNQTLATKLGFDKDEIIGQDLFVLYYPDCRELVKNQLFPGFLKTGEMNHEDLQLLCKDGGKLPVSLRVSAVRDEHGNILESRSICRDITDLKQSENRFSALIDNSPSAISLKGRDGKYTVANKTWREWFCPKGTAFIGKSVEDIFPADLATRAQSQDNEVLMTKKAIKRELPTPPSGRDRPHYDFTEISDIECRWPSGCNW